MEGLRTLVREKHARLSRFAEPFMHKNAPSFYQDRLGTNA
jgi:hypothetical protein